MLTHGLPTEVACARGRNCGVGSRLVPARPLGRCGAGCRLVVLRYWRWAVARRLWWRPCWSRAFAARYLWKLLLRIIWIFAGPRSVRRFARGSGLGTCGGCTSESCLVCLRTGRAGLVRPSNWTERGRRPWLPSSGCVVVVVSMCQWSYRRSQLLLISKLCSMKYVLLDVSQSICKLVVLAPPIVKKSRFTPIIIVFIIFIPNADTYVVI